MYVIEKGVLSHSQAYFYTPSQLAKSILFYVICAGHFYCDSNYHLKRKSYNSFLFMYIRAGEGAVYFDDKVVTAKAGDIVLLNCYRPHAYSTEGWETVWCHFDGNICTEYFNLIYNRSGCVLPLHGSPLIPDCLQDILQTLQSGQILNEHLVSCHIQRMLAEIYGMAAQYPSNGTEQDHPMVKAITYIKANYASKISLNDLAEHLCMSVYYFCRVFKKTTGYSPYEYVTMVRLNHAKDLLKTTKLTVKEISFATGFNSEANFITCFKQHTKNTPTEFRKVPF